MRSFVTLIHWNIGASSPFCVACKSLCSVKGTDTRKRKCNWWHDFPPSCCVESILVVQHSPICIVSFFSSKYLGRIWVIFLGVFFFKMAVLPLTVDKKPSQRRRAQVTTDHSSPDLFRLVTSATGYQFKKYQSILWASDLKKQKQTKNNSGSTFNAEIKADVAER